MGEIRGAEASESQCKGNTCSHRKPWIINKACSSIRENTKGMFSAGDLFIFSSRHWFLELGLEIYLFFLPFWAQASLKLPMSLKLLTSDPLVPISLNAEVTGECPHTSSYVVLRLDHWLAMHTSYSATSRSPGTHPILRKPALVIALWHTGNSRPWGVERGGSMGSTQFQANLGYIVRLWYLKRKKKQESFYFLTKTKTNLPQYVKKGVSFPIKCGN